MCLRGAGAVGSRHFAASAASMERPGMTSRVYVTGIGQSSIVGDGIDALWRQLEAPAPQRPIADPNTSAAGPDAASVGFLRSAREALEQARLTDERAGELRLGLIVAAFDVEPWLGTPDVGGSWLHRLCNEAGAQPGLLAFLRGRQSFVSTACASGLDALGVAYQWVARGSVDACLVVAGDSISRPTFEAMRLLCTLSPDRMPRPFDLGRNGTALAAGTAAMVLCSHELLSRAAGRPLARILGHGAASDVAGLVAPDADGKGLAAAMAQALHEAGLSAAAVDVVCAHASGTPLGDRVELEGIERAFGDNPTAPFVTANKGTLGHTLGASGAFSAIHAILMLCHHVVTPIANLQEPLKASRLGLLRDALVHDGLNTVLVNAVGFGGQNSSLLLEGCDAMAPRAS